MFCKSAILTACLFLQAHVVAGDLESCLTKFEQGKGLLTVPEEDPCLVMIRHRELARNEALWNRVYEIIKSDQASISIRAQLLIIASEQADREIALKLVSLLRDFASELDASGPLRNTVDGGDQRLDRKAVLLGSALRGCVEHIQKALTDQTPLLELLKILATTRVTHGWGYPARRAIAANPAPLEVRRAYAVQLIAHDQHNMVISDTLLELLAPSVFPELRKLVRESNDPDSFHFGAASALAHFGDEEILDDLEARRPVFRARHANMEGALLRLIWTIKIQHPPRELLKYIASDEDRLRVGLRIWAVRRATALQVPKAEIRNAILKFIERRRAQYKSTRGLVGLKKISQDLGVLNSEDLSDVPELIRSPDD